MRKRITSLLLALVMLFSLAPALGGTASAYEEDTVKEVRTYGELKEALKTVNSVGEKSVTVKLMNDIETIDYLYPGMGIAEGEHLTVAYGFAGTLDLNGYTLDLDSRDTHLQTFIRVYGDLEITDTSPGQTGKIVSDGNTKNVLAIDSSLARFKLTGGTISGLSWEATIWCKDGVTVIEGGTVKSENGVAVLLRNSTRPDDLQVFIKGGEFDGRIVTRFYHDAEEQITPANPYLTIQGGTFLKKIELEVEDNSIFKKDHPLFIVEGGKFMDEVKFPWWHNSYKVGPTKIAYNWPPARLYGGEFHGTVDLKPNNSTAYKLQLMTGGAEYQRAVEVFELMFGRSALYNHGIHAGPEVWKGIDFRTPYGMEDEYLNLTEIKKAPWQTRLLLLGTPDQPIVVKPNAWGIKEVLLDGEPIEYDTQWHTEGLSIDNDREHTLTFKWYDPYILYSSGTEYVSGAYIYRITHAGDEDPEVFDIPPQSSRVNPSQPFEATFTIPEGAPGGSLYYSAHIKLEKRVLTDEGTWITTPSMQQCRVKLEVNEVPEPEPPITGTVIHPSAIVYGQPISTEVVGLPEGVGDADLSFQWQRQINGGAWTNIEGVTTRRYTPTETDLGENVRIRVLVAAKGCLGQLAGSPLKVGKGICWEDPVWPQVEVQPGYTGLRITNWQPDQEYVYTTVPSDGWPKDGTPITDATVTGLTSGQTYYIYTRIKGTDTHDAGFHVARTTTLLADANNLSRLILKEGDVAYTDYGLGNTIFIKRGESITLNVDTNPSNANKWSAFIFSADGGVAPTIYTVTTSKGSNKVEPNERISTITITGTQARSYGESLAALVDGHFQDSYGSWRVFVYDEPTDVGLNADIIATLDRASVTMYEGDTISAPGYNVSVYPQGALDDYKYEWRVVKLGAGTDGGLYRVYDTDNGYLSIDPQTGEVTALAEHIAETDLTYKEVALCVVNSEGSVQKELASYQVTVEPRRITPISGIGISPKLAKLDVDETLQLSVATEPANAAGTETMSWSSENETIATVDQNGNVTGVAPGATKVTVTYGPYTRFCTVLVEHDEHVFDGQPTIYLDPETHYQECSTCGNRIADLHDFSDWVPDSDGVHHSRTCSACTKPGESGNYKQTEEHTWQTVVDEEATTAAPGRQHEECAVCGYEKPDSETLIPQFASVHVEHLTVTAPVRGQNAAKAATTDTGCYLAATRWLDGDGNELAVGQPFQPGTVYSAEIILLAKEGSLFSDGSRYNAIAGKVPQVKRDMDDSIAILTYTFDRTEGGGTTGGGGGGSVTTYAITVKGAGNGSVTSSHSSAAKGTAVTLTVTPDKGYVLDKITVLDSKDNAVKLTEKDGKFTFPMPASAVTVQATFKAQTPAGHPFIDIPVGSWYEDAVAWAVDKGITSGVSATTFDPNGICSRAQIVAFLWRAAGSPEPKTNTMPFTDVKADSYYHDAVLWAVEQGITAGTSATTFAPDLNCSRAQIVTFLYRAAGSPAVSGSPAFSDVAPDAYYAKAVKWAQANGITSGIGGGLFGSDNDCTRAQIVTFIYRYMEK